MSPRDRLADRLVRDGEPDPELVCATAPPLGSLPPPNGPALPGFWSIIGRAMPSSPPARGEATGAP